MKNLKWLVSICLLLASHVIQAQCANPFFAFRKGTKIGMTSYNAKSKPEGHVLITVKDISTTGDGYTSVMHSQSFDSKDKMLFEGEYTLECKNDVVSIDMQSMVSPQMTQALGDFQVEVSGTNMVIPAELSVGKVLPDAYIDIKTVNSPMSMSIRTDVRDRKVVEKVSIETPAGKFDCYKISYIITSKVVFANVEMEVIDYIAEKVGTVKTESYRKGKLQSYSELTTFEY
ncbi:MAG: hypothetical protein JJU28_23925 [Cyclobacteriaceae bacterium]|nr:hypothetical protein [Cyclobacteriaceae bacterium]